MGGLVGGWVSGWVYVRDMHSCRERKRERERECVCVCEREAGRLVERQPIMSQESCT